MVVAAVVVLAGEDLRVGGSLPVRPLAGTGDDLGMDEPASSLAGNGDLSISSCKNLVEGDPPG